MILFAWLTPGGATSKVPKVPKISKVTAKAQGKVNIHLGVGPIRDDGYHELSTVFMALDLSDTITVEATTGVGVTTLDCAETGVPTNARNLAWRGAELVLQRYGRLGKTQGLKITIEKGIPTAGGMAGGSADAAAAMVATNHMLGGRLSQAELLSLGAQLGADIPFTILGGVALGQGRGDELRPCESKGKFHFALVFSDTGLSTPEVFRTLDSMDRISHMDSSRAEAALRLGDADALAEAMCNDLQPAALKLQPALADILAAGQSAGALRGIISGSGPTCAFLSPHEESARAIARALSPLARTAIASGPARGAYIERIHHG
ncbi:4-(cytidine 5'-diphospho)-2-C-methyl-D-erythritol kinase [Corynebacterium sp. ES2794-CONJ1]|nr:MULTISPECIES: 4-(cytidine 5'-diphospho)-2-C-methyl-D-erythritol kinase [unclassified Corynebacterium]MCS4489986.1 4-(cytidine 5'-diphospho)-2-C-methyl-D-erythritol kinase [Corynebacterium sp. ES2775-CONJ]MCS4531756.1 4-(cytidine 5'-diphospho)-2-C-methyl-D-erythritol kinase [Corynebacterium sp. ES2730-CONJ]MCU9519152.1 4-(cytidine 5'-diphospho)-2-C-methyl-D-erythritol kinase [Corynebacterium sp. ES2794-CONJ1]